jgi:hypothetical protein
VANELGTLKGVNVYTKFDFFEGIDSEEDAYDIKKKSVSEKQSCSD